MEELEWLLLDVKEIRETQNKIGWIFNKWRGQKREKELKKNKEEIQISKTGNHRPSSPTSGRYVQTTDGRAGMIDVKDIQETQNKSKGDLKVIKGVVTVNKRLIKSIQRRIEKSKQGNRRSNDQIKE